VDQEHRSQPNNDTMMKTEPTVPIVDDWISELPE
jgi:hypothetical protein